jgi:hypothetical protein
MHLLSTLVQETSLFTSIYVLYKHCFAVKYVSCVLNKCSVKLLCVRTKLSIVIVTKFVNQVLEDL